MVTTYVNTLYRMSAKGGSALVTMLSRLEKNFEIITEES